MAFEHIELVARSRSARVDGIHESLPMPLASKFQKREDQQAARLEHAAQFGEIAIRFLMQKMREQTG